MKSLKKILAVLLAFAMILGSVSVAASAVDKTIKPGLDTPGTIDVVLKAYRYNDETGKYDIETTKAKPGEEIQIRCFIDTDFYLIGGVYLTAFENNFFKSAFGTTIKNTDNGDSFLFNSNYTPKLDTSTNYFLTNFVKGAASYNTRVSGWINKGLVPADYFDDIDAYLVTFAPDTTRGAQVFNSNDCGENDWVAAYNVIVKDDITETVDGAVVPKSGCESGTVRVPEELNQPLATVMNIKAPTYFERCANQGDRSAGSFTNSYWDSTLNSTPAVISICSDVILDANGGILGEGAEAATQKAITGVIGENVHAIGTYIPKREGYTFLGWSMEPGDPNDTDSDVEILTAAELVSLEHEYEDYTIYAQWKKTIANEVEYSYSVYFMDENGNYSDPDVVTDTAYPETTAKLPLIHVPGFEIDTVNSNTNGIVSEDGTVVPELKILYKRSSYKLTFNYKDMSGEQSESFDILYGADIPSYEELSGIPAPTMVGYNFVGWSTVQTTNPAEMAAAPQKMPMADVDLYPVYVKIIYTYLFDAGVGEFADGTKLKTLEFAYGATPSIINDKPSALGKDFIDWDNSLPTTVTSDLTFTAMFNDIMYDAKFVDELGNPIDGCDVYYGNVINLSDFEISDDYPEDCWTVNGQFVTFPYTITGNVTFEANLEATKYTASFYVDGELFKEDVYVINSEIVHPDAPAKEGYTFEVWKDPVNESILNPGEIICSDVRYDAEYKINKYTITFNTDDGTEIAPITQDYGTAIEPVAVPSKEGYTFKGWSTPIPNTMPAEDMTIDAIWEINTHTISFVDTDGTTIDEITQEYGTDVVAPADPTKEGYTFDTWDKEIPQTMPDEDVVITASWTVNSYTVTWIIDGEQTEETYDFGATIVAPTDTAKEGYTFTGWDPEVPATMPAENLTFTAQYDANTHTVVFNANGGEFEDGTSTYMANVAYGDEINAPADPSREDHVFTGWSPVVPNAMPNSDQVFNAQWDYVGDVVYNINVYTVDPTTGETITTTITKTASNNQVVEIVANGEAASENADIVIPYESLINSVSNVPDVDNEGNVLSLQVVKGENNVLEVYFKLAEFEVTFNAGEGEFPDGSNEYSSEAVYGSMTQPDAEPFKEGCNFIGWYDVDTGAKVEMPYYVTGELNCEARYEPIVNTVEFYVNDELYKSEEYACGDEITAPAYAVPTGYELSDWTPELPATMGTEALRFDATLTAKNFKVTYSINNAPAGVTDPEEETYSFGDTVTVAAAPEAEGYTFNGWTSENNATYTPGTGTFTMPASNVTLYGSFTANEYKIHFDVDFGSDVPDAVYSYGELIIEPVEPVKPGYTFQGWMDVDDNTMVVFDDDLTMPAKDKVYKAIWEEIPPEMYTVTYIYDGDVPETVDALPAAAEYEVGSTVTVADAPSAVTGYSFLGWNYNNRPVDSFVMPENDVTIVGVWAKKAYTITFDTDGGSSIAPVAYNYGDTVAEPAAPTKDGYTFAGWQNLPETMPAENVTAKALWEPIAPDTYKVTYKYEGVVPAGAPAEPTDATEYLAGDTVTVKALPELEGYNFVGWTYSGGTFVEGATITMPASDVTFKGEFKPAAYTLSFDTVDGSYIAPVSYNYGDTVVAPADPTKTGYTFAGWDNLPNTMPAQDVTATAKWTPNQYTITFNTDGGSTIAPATYDYGEPVVAPADPTKTGYTFDGWNNLPATMPAQDVTATAKWVANKYTITFDTDHGSFVAPITQDYDTPVTEPAAPTREGYIFVGWVPALPAKMPANDMTVRAIWEEVAPDKYTVTWVSNGAVIRTDVLAEGDAIVPPTATPAEGQVFVKWTPDVPATMGTTNLTFTAVFDDVAPEVVTATFNANGGEFEDGTASKQVEVESGATPEVPAEPSREGYNFLGWSTDADATEPEEIGAITEDTTIYAVWEEIVPDTYTVTYYKAEGVKYLTQTYAEGDAIVAPAAPSAEGWTFGGWKIAGTDEDIPATMPAENLEVVAKWELNGYKATFISEGETVAQYDVLYGAAVPVPADPTREGYNFAGWEPTVDATMPAHDVTYTAKWNEIPVEPDVYVATYVVDDKTYASYNVEAGDSIPVPKDPMKLGYKFVGWDPEVPSEMPEGDITFTAKWEKDDNTTLLIIGGVAVTGAVIGAIVGASTAAWITTVSVVGGVIVIWGVSKLVKHTYTVTYYVDGEVYKTYKVLEGTKVPTPKAPSKEGAEFEGWDPEVPSKMPGHDLEFNAKWSDAADTDVDVDIPDTGSVAGLTAFATISAAAAVAYIYTRKKNKEEN